MPSVPLQSFDLVLAAAPSLETQVQSPNFACNSLLMQDMLATGPHTYPHPQAGGQKVAPTTGSVLKWLGGVVVTAEDSGTRLPWFESWLYDFSAVCCHCGISYLPGREGVTTVPTS